MIEEATRQEILRLEQLRCSALMANDTGALGSLMADDLVHIHGTGGVEGKDAYLAGVRTKYRFHRVERGALEVRLYGNVAIVTGPLDQAISIDGAEKILSVSAMVTQVWIYGVKGWRQNTCHNAFLSVS